MIRTPQSGRDTLWWETRTNEASLKAAEQNRNQFNEVGPIVQDNDPSRIGLSGFADKRHRVLDLDLTNARTDELFEVRGTVLDYNVATDATPAPDNTVELEVRFNDPKNPKIKIYPGKSYSGIPFDRIYISHTAQANFDAQLVIIEDTPKDRIDID